MFIDVHCHIDRYDNPQKIIANAKEKNVIMVAQGVDRKSNMINLELARANDNVRVAMGVYPIEGLSMSDSELDEEIKFIRQNKNNIIALGEIGIDLKESDNFIQQRKNLIKFIELASELNKPMIVHSRDAEEKTIELLEEFGAKKVIMHCFSGRFKFSERIVKNGWYLSVPTNITRNQQFQNMAEKIPIENLFCETDSPFLNPFNRDDENEPALVLESYRKVAEYKRMKIEDVEKAMEDNFERLFNQKITGV